jgi:hypothetical protein
MGDNIGIALHKTLWRNAVQQGIPDVCAPRNSDFISTVTVYDFRQIAGIVFTSAHRFPSIRSASVGTRFRDATIQQATSEDPMAATILHTRTGRSNWAK